MTPRDIQKVINARYREMSSVEFGSPAYHALKDEVFALSAQKQAIYDAERVQAKDRVLTRQCWLTRV